MKKRIKYFNKCFLSILLVLIGSYVMGRPGLPVVTASSTGLDIAWAIKNQVRTPSCIMSTICYLQSKGSDGKWKTVDATKSLIQRIQWDPDTKMERYLFRFIGGLKHGITFLSMEQPDPNDDIQFVYVPALRRPRAVGAQDLQNDYEDTDFTYEDLGSRKIGRYDYKRLPDESYRGVPSYVIEGTMKDKTNARKPVLKSWVSKKELITIKTIYYDRNNRHVRSFYCRDIRFTGHIYTPFLIKSVDHTKNHQTILKFTYVKTDFPLQRNEFDSSRLGDTWRIN